MMTSSALLTQASPTPDPLGATFSELKAPGLYLLSPADRWEFGESVRNYVFCILPEGAGRFLIRTDGTISSWVVGSFLADRRWVPAPNGTSISLRQS